MDHPITRILSCCTMSEIVDEGITRVYNEVVSLLAHMDDQTKSEIALRIALISETKLASVVTVLLEKLQQDEQNRVDIYYVLNTVLLMDIGGLERRLLKKIITLASSHMRETQEATNELKVAASDILVTLAGCYFNDVMSELQSHLKPPELPEEFIFITLGNLSAYALECIPFVGRTLYAMFLMLELVKDSRLRQAFCGELKMSKEFNVFNSRLLNVSKELAGVRLGIQEIQADHVKDQSHLQDAIVSKEMAGVRLGIVEIQADHVKDPPYLQDAIGEKHPFPSNA
ncbi:dynein light chain 4, axonemal [Platysternon megacephalum]|uniref:Dynein light chain 4, axonemal n=1 Tax=Platysternon megacephalum TaxID=55544 RepID=A0A4D9DIC3_9SAUR|nr:dynein light chain 4, axonemal [Platysternon megacephalum]